MDGTVVASQDGATAWIDSQAFTLDLPEVYRQGITLNSVLGQLSARWDRKRCISTMGCQESTTATMPKSCLALISRSNRAVVWALLPCTSMRGCALSHHGRPAPLRSLFAYPLAKELAGCRHRTGANVGYQLYLAGRFQKLWSGLPKHAAGGVPQRGLGCLPARRPAVTDLSGSLHIDTDRVSVWETVALFMAWVCVMCRWRLMPPGTRGRCGLRDSSRVTASGA